MLKIILTASAVALMATAAQAQYRTYGTGSNSSSTYVQPHINSNGSYTSGHYRTTPNNTQMDNYGSRGNYNPYNGTYGTRNPRY
jgi:hypothetical protein